MSPRTPTPEEYEQLRSAMGWPAVGREAAQRTLRGSWWVGTVYSPEQELRGLVRVIGDGALTFYIADVMVHPHARGRGLGDVLMAAALEKIRPAAIHGATVAVVPISGREAFYEKHGFVAAAPFGSGMVWAESLEGLLSR